MHIWQMITAQQLETSDWSGYIEHALQYQLMYTILQMAHQARRLTQVHCSATAPNFTLVCADLNTAAMLCMHSADTSPE